MIDEKRLDEYSEAFRSAYDRLRPTTAMEISLYKQDMDEKQELLRLARLGLWAEKHGVPALRSVTVRDPWDKGSGVAPEAVDDAKRALEKLPKSSD